MPTVRFPSGTTAEVAIGTDLLSAARSVGVGIETPCNGAGTCGKCLVRIRSAELDRVDWSAAGDLPVEQLAAGLVPACLTTVRGDVEVALVERGDRHVLQILDHGSAAEVGHDPFITAHDDGAHTSIRAGGREIARWDGAGRHPLGAAIDIGTTTLVASLVDLADGRELGSASALNPQALHAQDVLSRIAFAGQEGGLGTLHGVLIAELNRLISVAAGEAGVEPGHVVEAVLGGNTCMLHLAARVDPRPLGKFPYTVTERGDTHRSASELGLAIAPAGLVWLPPVMSAYVGADITAGLLSTRLWQRGGTTLFVDIGTNGEMVLAADGRLVATSTAAGPAFEGMNIACGMRAAPGAIEEVAFSTDGVRLRTIADIEPIGLCGSGLLDAVGELAHWGVVDGNGRFAKPGQLPPALAERVFQLDGKPAFRLTPRVHLTQKDVRQVQLAKGAVRAGIDLLLAAVGVPPERLDAVLIAGSFGYHLRTRSLINLGLLPAAVADRVEFVGNTSKTGARAFLVDQSTRSELREVIRDVRVLELANDLAFQKTFIEALSFPRARARSQETTA